MFKLVFSSGDLADVHLKETLNVGRDPSNEVALPLATVSGFHAKLTLEDSIVKLTDLNSTNGTYVNGKLINRETEVVVGDVIEFDTVTARLVAVSSPSNLSEPPSLSLTGIGSENAEVFKLNHLTTNSIGRDPSSTIFLNRQEISWHHANIYVRNGLWILEDLDSTNGTFQSGQRIEKVYIVPGDVVSFSAIPFRISSDEEKCELVTKSHDSREQSICEVGIHDQYLIVSRERIPLVGDKVTIGRIEGNDILLDNPTVSTRHAVLKFEVDSWWIEDLNSTNGTYVNAQKVTRTKIIAGATLKFGAEEVAFVDPSYAAPATAPSVVIMVGED